MMTEDDGRRRVELASETITKHIVGITGDIGEEEETNKRRREETGSATTAENLAADEPTWRTLPTAAPPGAEEHLQATKTKHKQGAAGYSALPCHTLLLTKMIKTFVEHLSVVFISNWRWHYFASCGTRQFQI